jgi:hypothetical protein
MAKKYHVPGFDYEGRKRLIIADRAAGLDNRAIGAKYDMAPNSVRALITKMIRRGEVTREQVRVRALRITKPYQHKSDDFYRAKLKATVRVLPSGCWEWQGFTHKEPNPYGEMSYRGKAQRTHRLSYMLFKGPIPAGLDICHECDYKRCINPDHLFLGTHRDNMLDMRDKRKMYQDRITHCPRGHEYTPENTALLRTKIGGIARNCKTCQRDAQRIRHRLESGWPMQLAVSVPPVPPGYRLVKVFVTGDETASPLSE